MTNSNINSDKVYVVGDNETGAEVLVRARGLQTAIDHVAAGRFYGRMLKSGELLDAITAGATVEIAGEKEQSAAEPAEEAAPKTPTPAPTTDDKEGGLTYG